MSSKKGPFRGVIVLALIILALMSARIAQAQPAGAQAEVLFRQGKDLMAAGKIAEACAAFDASQKLDPTVSTLLNQANCRERNGQLATAWGLFLEVERQTRAGTDKASQQMHTTAASRAAKLEPRLSTLRIEVPADHRAGGLEIARNGEVLDPATWNQALPIDGGTYDLVARAPGAPAWSITIAVAAERDAKIVEIPQLGGAKPASPPPPPLPPRAEEPSAVRAPARDAAGANADRAPAPSRVPASGAGEVRAPAPASSPARTSPSGVGSMWTARRKLAVGTAAGGVVALAAGTVLGVSAKRAQRDAQSLCPDRRLGCDDAERANERLLSGHHRAIGANIAFGIGAGAVIATGVLWVTGAPESRRGVAVMPAASPGQVLVTASGSF